MEALEEWLMAVNKSHGAQKLKPEFFYEIINFFIVYWNLNVTSITTEGQFYNLLTPQLQNKVNLYSSIFLDN
jgi:hypothetical protein